MKIINHIGLKIAILGFLLVLLFPNLANARDASQITDWYIKDFHSDIVVNTDSSLLITEKITADCGNLPDKHGIFRTLPTYYQKTAKEKVETPINLISVTDFNNNKINYSISKDRLNKTITWKIGDPKKAVTGVNYYKIIYEVKNTIRFDNPNFDEFYWNLSGNFWQIDIDNFTAAVHFPEGLNQETVKEINLYSGQFGANNTSAIYKWQDKQTFVVEYPSRLSPSNGITLSATFPKNIITPCRQSPLEKYGWYPFLLIPLIVFIYAYRYWNRYGRVPKLNRPVMAEYDIPEGLQPLEFGILYHNGQLRTPIISAAIINLAVKKHLKIEHIPKKGILGKEDFKLIQLTSSAEITQSEKDLLGYLFSGKNEVLLSELKDKFYTKISVLKDSALTFLKKRDFFDEEGFKRQVYTIFLGLGLVLFGVLMSIILNIIVAGSFIISGLIIIIFGILMQKRTRKGAETYWRIQGFKLFISMTEKYRQQFNEKENIFEKFLPYAMIFGLTKVWINNMKKIYGAEYFNTYHPYWFYGPAFVNFNADSFNEMVDNLSKNMNSVISSNPSSSGSGGGGFSGGGGGGGGGGGW